LKISASKRKGLWMGCQVPLGYRVRDRKWAERGLGSEQEKGRSSRPEGEGGSKSAELLS
jgi:hypothetical protein